MPRIRDGLDQACEHHPAQRWLGCPACWAESDDPHRHARLRMVQVLRGLLGAPFRHRGRSPTGLDCSGLALVAFRQASMWTQDHDQPYGTTFAGEAFVNAWRRVMDEIPLSAARPASIVLMRLRGRLCHAQFVSDAGTVIHVGVRTRTVVEFPITDAVVEAVEHAFDHRDLAEARDGC